MKELHGTAAEFVAAPLDQCFALLADIDGYPSWYPDAVRGVEVLDHDGDGRPSRVRAKLHLSQGPLVKDFQIGRRPVCQIVAKL